MDKQKIVIALLIISIALSAITVGLSVASSPRNGLEPVVRNNFIKETVVKESPPTGGISFELTRGGP